MTSIARLKFGKDTLGLRLCFSMYLGVAACSGKIPVGSTPNEEDDPAGEETPGILPPEAVSERTKLCRKQGIKPAPAPLSRLTVAEYKNTVRDLLPGLNVGTLDLPRDDVQKGFDNLARGQNAGPAVVEGFARTAQSLASEAAKNLDKLIPCAAGGTPQAACGKTFIASFGQRAFRRPLTPEETERYDKVFQSIASSNGLPAAVAAVTEIFLQSPHFLYRPEIGGGASSQSNEALRLTPYEMASRLSYLLLDTMPDADLFAAAADGSLAEPAGLERQARRLLSDERARPAIASFHRQWLGLAAVEQATKDQKLFPAWNDRVATALVSSAERFVDDVFWERGGKFDTLLTDNHAWVNADVAHIYGVPAPAKGAWERVELDASQRAGLITDAGLLAANAFSTASSPVRRGLFVLDKLLCIEIGSAPPNVNTDQPAAMPGSVPKTTRQLFEQQHTAPECASCHKVIDGVGFALEGFDAVGKWRTTDNGINVNTESVLVGIVEGNGRINGAVELANRVAESPLAADCLARQWVGYASAVEPIDVDDCSLSELVDSFVESKFDMKSLLLAMVTSDAFRFRPAPAK